MIQLFDVQEKRVIPAIACYLIPELKAIMDLFPDEYLKIYQYIFGMTCPDSTNWYINLEESRKEDVILSDIKPYKFYIDDMKIALAIKKCEMLFETPSMRIVQGAKMMLDEMGRNLRNPLTFGKEGNATDMRGIMKEIRGYRQDYVEMENALKEEQAKVRGSMKLRYDQKPDYVDLKADKDED